MEARLFSAVILFFANKWSEEVAIEIFGKVLGEHFYSKWCSCAYSSADQATMRLFYSMSHKNLQAVIDYIKSTNYNGAND